MPARPLPEVLGDYVRLKEKGNAHAPEMIMSHNVTTERVQADFVRLHGRTAALRSFAENITGFLDVVSYVFLMALCLLCTQFYVNSQEGVVYEAPNLPLVPFPLSVAPPTTSALFSQSTSHSLNSLRRNANECCQAQEAGRWFEMLFDNLANY